MNLRACGAAVAVGSAVVLSACGGGSGSGGDDVITIMTVAPLESPTYSVPWIEDAVQAAVDDLNDDGGIDGKKIEVIVCNDKFDPNEATACAQRAASEKVDAVVGMSPYVSSMAPVLEAASIPFVGPPGADAVFEATNDMMYPINGGGVSQMYGAGYLAVTRGGSDVAVVVSDNQGARTAGELTQSAVESAGGTATTVIAPMGAADYASTAASVLSQDPDAVAMQGAGTDLVRVISALRQAGYDGVIVGNSSIVSADSLEALGEDGEGLLLSSRGLSALDTENATIAEFGEQMRAEDPDAVVDDLGLNSWMSVRLLAKVLDGREVTDGASVIEALNAIEEPIEQDGVYPAYPGLSGSVPEEEYPRVAVFEAIANTIENGEVVSDGDFFNPLEVR